MIIREGRGVGAVSPERVGGGEYRFCFNETLGVTALLLHSTPDFSDITDVFYETRA